MPCLRRLQRFAWIALVAILGHVLASTPVAATFASDAAARSAELCSTAMGRADVAADPAEAGPASGHPDDGDRRQSGAHCLLCGPSLQGPALHPPERAIIPAGPRLPPVPAPPPRAAAIREAWFAAPSRAPPVAAC